MSDKSLWEVWESGLQQERKDDGPSTASNAWKYWLCAHIDALGIDFILHLRTKIIEIGKSDLRLVSFHLMRMIIRYFYDALTHLTMEAAFVLMSINGGTVNSNTSSFFAPICKKDLGICLTF
jgi:hypothetical protein